MDQQLLKASNEEYWIYLHIPCSHYLYAYTHQLNWYKIMHKQACPCFQFNFSEAINESKGFIVLIKLASRQLEARFGTPCLVETTQQVSHNWLQTLFIMLWLHVHIATEQMEKCANLLIPWMYVIHPWLIQQGKLHIYAGLLGKKGH